MNKCFPVDLPFQACQCLISSPLDDLCIDIWMSVMINLSQNPDDKEIGYSNVLANARPFEHMFFFGGSSFTSLTTSNHVTDKRTHPLCDFMQHKLTSLEDADIISTNSVDLSNVFFCCQSKETKGQRAEHPVTLNRRLIFRQNNF